MIRHFTLASLIVVGLAPMASAQFNNQWTKYANESATRLSGTTPSTLSNNSVEVDLDYGDLDKNGFTDVVVVRKEPNTSFGKRTNVLLMNYNGVLTDVTATFATAADVPGDQGFLTPTNDRDVEVADVDGDGWLDVITAPALATGSEPKHIDHPRVYMNLGESSPGNWNGLRFEDARFPQLVASSGNTPGANTCGIAAGDIDNDGDADLYLVDYDSGNGGGSNDLGDRLMINDGNGFFSDGSSAVNGSMLSSAFGNSGHIVDLNGDGNLDIIKSMNGPVNLVYNDPNNVGSFPLYQNVYGGAAYHHAVGDLNADGKVDFTVGDDGADRYSYNTGNDALGRVIWGPTKTYQFLAGGDDGFSNNNIIQDLDGDGWNDVVVGDVDVDVGGCSRRIHIYHNPGGNVGDQITLREERQSSSGGWLGAEPFLNGDLTGGHDIVSFDINNDGGDDLILGRCTGTFVWMNQDFCPKPIQYGAGEVGSHGNTGTTSWTGSTASNSPGFTIEGSGFLPNSFAFLITGQTQGSNIVPWGEILIGGVLFRTVGATNADGDVSFSIDTSIFPAGVTRTFQIVGRDPGFGGNIQTGNAVEAMICP